MRLRPANCRDLPSIRVLMQADQLPDGDVADHLATFLVGEQAGSFVAAGGFEVLGSSGLLRSVAVTHRYRGRGWGQRLVGRLLLQARALGLADLYLLTTTAQDFFARFGFRPVPREAAPPRVRGTRQFTISCPASATLMYLDLTQEHP
jgi:amino-acid N-acetyltransferase